MSFYQKHKKGVWGAVIAAIIIVIIIVVSSGSNSTPGDTKPDNTNLDNTNTNPNNTTPDPIPTKPTLSKNDWHTTLDNGLVGSTVKTAMDLQESKLFIDGKIYYKVLLRHKGTSSYLYDYDSFVYLKKIEALNTEYELNRAIWLVEFSDANMWKVRQNYNSLQYLAINQYKQPTTSPTLKEWTYDTTTRRISEAGGKFLEYNPAFWPNGTYSIGLTVDTLIAGTMSEFDIEYIHDPRIDKSNSSYCRTNEECKTKNCTGGVCLPPLQTGQKYKMFFKYDQFGRYLCASNAGAASNIYMSDDQIRDGCTWVVDVVDNKLRILNSSETEPKCMIRNTTSQAVTVAKTGQTPNVCTDDTKWTLSKYNWLMGSQNACISYGAADSPGYASPSYCGDKQKKLSWTPEYFGLTF